ncbi:SDR family NAD(P)-dependent oxidoreductase [Thermoproteus tenax]|uniref:Short-chain dehydrogenase n=1 Tax=Thermoproteus tenax (strain ATCC 35583 / DSM 2078 / JCM 9277 / NBRC 100435 / Kra 1) TaxID=768679 RepID=G4RQ66_THETK|nr:SDR family NAD(P)-dependent oxidoreductase [Thermoproteus tenax]CCC80703.1 Short-chain dehydrogenase [Thermoproteus tenax Kra 1]
MNKTALITGASSGIGRALAEELAAKSYDLILVARRADALGELSSELSSKYNIEVRYFARDLSQLEEVDALARDVERTTPRVYALVNNAGAGLYGPLQELQDRDVVSIITLNFVAPILLTKKLLPKLVEARGCIVNVVSLAAHTPIPWFGIYTSTKAALANFTDALRIELKPIGVRVIGVYPGYVQTNFHKNTIVAPSAAKQREGPRGPVLDPRAVAKDIARAIDDPEFNGDIVTGLAYKLFGALARPLYPLTKIYVDRWFRSKLSGRK